MLLAALTWVAAEVAQLIHARVRSEYLRGILLRLDDAVLAAVREVHQVIVEETTRSFLRGSSGSPGGGSIARARPRNDEMRKGRL